MLSASQGLEPFIPRFIPDSKGQETSSRADRHKLTQGITSPCKHQLMSQNEENAPLCYASASTTAKTQEWDLHLGHFWHPVLNLLHQASRSRPSHQLWDLTAQNPHRSLKTALTRAQIFARTSVLGRHVLTNKHGIFFTEESNYNF